MPLFDNPAELYQEGHGLSRDGKYSAAALLFAKAKEAARTQGEHAAAFQCGFWEVQEWALDGDLQRAFGLLLSLLSDVPVDAPPFERWFAQGLVFEIQLRIRPEHVRVERLFNDLVSLSDQLPHPAADLHSRRGQIAYARGEWASALKHYSRGWNDHDELGVLKCNFAAEAIRCCLQMNQRNEALSWWNHLSTTQQDEFEIARQHLKETSLLLALDAGDRDAVKSVLDRGIADKECQLRAHLFLIGDSRDAFHDPSDPSHPARKLAAITRHQNVHHRYEALLALVDYRLACLRFTVGLSAVDDLYYRQPDVIPKKITLTDAEKFQRQLHHFNVSWRFLNRHAQRLDNLLQCDWRTQEAQSRRERCDAIVKPCVIGRSSGKV